MKALRTVRATTVSLLVLGVCCAGVAQTQPARRVDASPVDLTAGVYVASYDAGDHALSRYSRERVVNTEGADLGSFRDFILQPQSNRIVYAVISTGGVLGGIGNTLRIVPIEALRRSADNRSFVIDILQSAWLQTPAISDDDYVNDRFAYSAAQHQAWLQQYGVAGRANPANAPVVVADPNTGAAVPVGLIRASKFQGKSVASGTAAVGKIEAVIADLSRGTAAALLETAKEFTGTRAKYLVPLNRFVLASAQQNPIGTNLTRADIDGARPGTLPVPDTAAARVRRETDEVLTPTGR